MIHVVEDDRGVSDAMVVLLAQMGHAVRPHCRAESVFAEGPPGPEDAFVVDLSLPGIDGARLVTWLLALAEPPLVVIITGQSAYDIEVSLAGMRPPILLRKPIDPATIASLFGDSAPLFPALFGAETCDLALHPR